jgi:putative DNA primase/helicase
MTLPRALEEALDSFEDDENQGTDTADSNNLLLLPSPSQPMAVARVFVRQCLHDKILTLRYWRGGWWMWKTSHWVEVHDGTVRSILYRFTENALYQEGRAPRPWAPNRHKIGDLIDALTGICLLPNEIDQPCWLDGEAAEDDVIVSVKNGLLDVSRRRLLPHTPLYFNQTSVPFNYDANAPQPRRWLDFLADLWPDQPDAVDVLGEWFGYVISGRTDLHKILLMVGPTRGGKGAIARILTAMIGRKNVAGPTLNSLGGEFGLAPLIGKPLAVISDARFAGRDASIVVERLLSISGEDTLTVNRKYRDQWSGKLPSRLHVLSNELPKLGDASTAIVGRMVLLLTTRSWLGREDFSLEPALHGELTGILNWALDGLQRLTVTNGNIFTPLPSADEAITSMRDLASPVQAFVREQCDIAANYEISVDALYAAYKTWAEDNGQSRSAGRGIRPAESGSMSGSTCAMADLVRHTLLWAADHRGPEPIPGLLVRTVRMVRGRFQCNPAACGGFLRCFFAVGPRAGERPNLPLDVMLNHGRRQVMDVRGNCGIIATNLVSGRGWRGGLLGSVSAQCPHERLKKRQWRLTNPQRRQHRNLCAAARSRPVNLGIQAASLRCSKSMRPSLAS